MKHTLRFVLILVALLGLMMVSQGSMVGACLGIGDSPNALNCPD